MITCANRVRHLESVRKRKRILVLSLLSFSVIIALLSGVRAAFAVEDSKEAGTLPESFYRDDVFDMDEEEVGSIFEMMRNQNEYLLDICNIFDGRPPSSGHQKTLLYSILSADGAIGKVGRDITSMVGATLVIIYGAVQFLNLIERSDDSMEGLMRILLTIVVGILLVIYIGDITSAIEDLGGFTYRLIAESLKNVMDKGGYIVTTPGNSISADGFNLQDTVMGSEPRSSQSLYAMLTGGVAKIIGSVLMLFSFFIIVSAAYGILFELVLRKVFAPIAVADVVSEGSRSPGVKFMKNYFGCYIRMAMFAAVIIIGWASTEWALHNPQQALSMNSAMGAIGVVSCIRFAMKALINASGQLSREIMGG